MAPILGWGNPARKAVGNWHIEAKRTADSYDELARKLFDAAALRLIVARGKMSRAP